MFKWFDAFIPSSLLTTPETQWRARFLVGWSLLALALTIFAIPFRLLNNPNSSAIYTGIFCILCFGSIPFLLRWTGKLALVGALPSLAILLSVLALGFSDGGLYNHSLPAILTVPLFGAFFMGHRYAGYITLLAVVALQFMTAGHHQGWYPDIPAQAASFRSFVLCISLLFVFGLVYLYERMQKQIDQRLATNEARYSLALESLEDGLFDWDIRTDRAHLSQQYRQLLGYGPTDTPPPPFAEECFPPTDYVRIQMALKQHIEEGAPLSIDTKIRKANGDTRWFHIRGNAIRENKQAVRIVGFVSDISNQKQLERVKEEFISNVGHEFRTPLTSIIGAIRLMAQADVLSQVQKQGMLDIAHRNSEQLLLLIDDLLDMQKLQSGSLPISRIWTDLPTLAEEAASAQESTSQKKRLHLRWQISPTVPPLLLDPDRMRQALGHLFHQAIEHSPNGGTITISIQREMDTEHTGTISLALSDQGPGIAAEDQPYVFDRLAHWDATRQSQGTGMGMALAKRIAEAHEGNIEFTTGTEGTTFTIKLPMETAQNKHHATPASSIPSPMGSFDLTEPSAQDEDDATSQDGLPSV